MSIYELTSADAEELELAVRRVVALRLDPAQLTPSQFPLQSLSKALAEIDRSAGYCVIRGIPVERFNLRETCILLCGLGGQFGRPMPQAANGEVIHHVRAVSAVSTRGYQTSRELPFHSDSCDTVGLLMIKSARSGGLSSLASAQAVHDAIAKTRPDLLRTLYEPFHIERHSGHSGYYSTPVFMRHQGRLFCRFNPGYVYSAQRDPSTPRLTVQQEDAIQLFLESCNSRSIRVDMELRPGDLQLLDNNAIVHARTAYIDAPETGKQRHLLRVWLFTSELADLPGPMRDRYRDMESWRSKIHVPVCD